MSRYSLSNESEKNIIGLYKFGFSKYGELVVEKYLESLQHKLQYLADNPLVCIVIQTFYTAHSNSPPSEALGDLHK